jgi:hypothetical protein
MVHTCEMLVYRVLTISKLTIAGLCLSVASVFLPLHAQTVELENLVWLSRQLLNLPADNGQIVEVNPFQEPAFFWPKEVTVPHNLAERPENLLRIGNALYVCIDGTGRVYRIAEDNGMRFIRIDSTEHSGYNFNAYHFTLRDTIFSLGGYGYWRHNGHLRYYNSLSHGWEIIPLNREIPMTLLQRSTHTKGIHVNPIQEKLHYVLFYRPEEFKKQQNLVQASYTDTTTIFELDLRRHDWKELGTITPDFFRYFSRLTKVADLPWGELVWKSPKSSQEMYLINYSANTMLALDREKSSRMLLLLFPPNGTSFKSFTVYADSSLVIVNTLKQKQVIPLTLADFKPTGIRLYAPHFRLPASLRMNTLSWLALLAGLLSSGFAFTYYFRHRKKESKDHHAGLLIFDPIELELLGALYTRPNNSMLTEEINFLLGTNKKSVEVQKKHRSDLIKSINDKFTRLTGDEGKLITQERLEDDRRLMKYVLHMEKYQRMIRQTKNGKNGKPDKHEKHDPKENKSAPISPPEPSSGTQPVH